MDTQLIEHFEKSFSIKIAKTKEDLDKVFKIRYNVYCQEFGFEDLNDDLLEIDKFDNVSLHCLIIHNETNIPAGCARLIPGEFIQLPIEHECNDLQLISNFNRNSICEISRLAVDPLFRRRLNENASKYGAISEKSLQDNRSFPLITIVALLACIVLTDIKKTPNGFAIMEPFLPRLLKRSNINFNKIGKAIEHHGIREPFYTSAIDVKRELPPELFGMYQHISEQIV